MMRSVVKVVVVVAFLLWDGCCGQNDTDSSFRWFMNMYDTHSLGNFSEMGVNKTCEMDMIRFADALKQEELWALQTSSLLGYLTLI